MHHAAPAGAHALEDVAPGFLGLAGKPGISAHAKEFGQSLRAASSLQLFYRAVGKI